MKMFGEGAIIELPEVAKHAPIMILFCIEIKGNALVVKRSYCKVKQVGFVLKNVSVFGHEFISKVYSRTFHAVVI